MNAENAMGAVDANEEILSLVETLVKTERRLEEITLGQVDCVVGRDGRPFLLGRAQEQLRYNEAAKQASILNALSAHIALLDFEGVIISVNEAWRRFAEANVHHAPGHGLGVNYLDVCDRARGACSSEGPQVAAGIRAVLEGLKTSYTIEYPCHSPTEQRWFELTVTPLADDHANGVVVMHLNITERKFAEEILRASEANMSAAQRIAHFGSWEKDLTDLEGASANSLRWSDEMFRIAGYEPGGCEVTTELFFRLVHPEDREPIRRAVASAIREHQAYSIVHRLIRPDGTTRVVREAGRIFFDEKTGAPLKIVATAHDITENRQAEALLQHKQAELQVILDTVPAMIFYKDRQHRLLRINAAAMRAHGWTTEGFVGKTDAELGLPHAEQYVRDEEEIAATGLPKRNIIEPVFTATGTRWFQTDKFPICDGAGSITGFIGLSMDITERKLAEEELERTRAQFAGLVNSMDGIVWEADATSFQFTFVSQRAQHILGFSSAEWLSTPDFWTRQIHPDDRREAVRYCVGCTGRKENHTFEYRMLAADGRSVWMRDIVTYVEEPGKPAMRRGIMLDITERKNAAAALKELSDRTERRERMLSTALASMSDFAQIYDCQGRFLFVNQPLLDLWGITLDAAVGKNFFELGYPGDLADRLARELQEVFQNRRSVTGETPYTDPTGRAGCYEYIFSPAFTADGEVDFVVGTTRDITERKDAENALRRNQKHLRGLIDGMGPAMFVGLLTTEGILIEVNQAPLAAAGLKMEDVLGKPFAETPWWSQSPAAQQQLREAIVRAARGEASRYDVRTHGANNAIIDIDFSLQPLRDETGEIVFLVPSASVITERKLAEAEIRDANEKFRQLADNISDAFWIRSPDFSEVQYASPAFEKIWGRSVESLKADPQQWPDLIFAEDRTRVLKSFSELTDDAPSLDIEYRIVRPGGEIRWVRARVFQVRNATDRLIRHVGVVTDITEWHQATDALRTSEAGFRTLAEAMPQIVWETQADGRNIYFNQQWMDYTGLTLEESQGEGWIKPFHPEDQEEARLSWQTATETKETHSMECRLRRADGVYRWWLVRGVPLQDTAGQIIKWVGTCTDIHELKVAQEKMSQQAALLDVAQDAILVKDLEGRIIYWNKGAERTYGWTSEEAIGSSSLELLQQEPVAHQKGRTMLLAHGSWQGEMISRSKAGSEIIADVRWTLVKDPHGQAQSVLAIHTEITGKKKLEAQFLRVQRMESIGTLASGIAHDLNNVLAPIMMSLEMLKDLAPGPDAQKFLDILQSCAQRGANLIKQVLSFARGVEGRRMPVNVVHILSDIENIIRDTFPKNIDFQFERPREPGAVLGDPTQLHQVFMNLCVNARDAMPLGGKLKVTIQHVMVDEIYADMNSDAKPGPYTIVQVEDTGLGIPSDIKSKIFEPFFTTKEIGKGTGLGLSTTLAIIKSHGGFINLYSEMGKGTQFKVYLPATPAARDGTEPAIRPALPRGEGELILVVDDEEPIRTVTSKTLERFNYRCVLAANGAEAIAVYARRGFEIALVLTDMAMPIMDGPATIVALRSLNPHVKIIGCSGHASTNGVAQALSAGVLHFIPKPYTAETLIKLLHASLSPDEKKPV